MQADPRHQCLIYDGAPSHHLKIIADILQRRLNEGYRCLYLNSPTMVAGMRSTLSAMGIDVANEIEKARLILSSETVSPGMQFNSDIMLATLEEYLDQAISDGYTGLWATGDMSWEFGAEKNYSTLMEYEAGLEALFRRRPEMCGICQYHKDSLPAEAMRHSLLTHPAIVINQTLWRANPHYVAPGTQGQHTASEDELDDMIQSICRRTG